MHILVRGGWFGHGAVKLRLERATKSLRTFCRSFGKQTALKKFSQSNLNFKSRECPDALV